MITMTMRALAAIWILTSGLAFGGTSQSAPLAPKHKAWVEDDAGMLVTPVEREVFLKLGSDQDRDRFIEEFWLQRDPTPGTPRNETRIEHFRRLAFADRVFGGWRGQGGRASERGRLYVLLGSPREVRKIEEPDLVPIEVWTYQNNPSFGGAALVRLLFIMPKLGQEYELYDPAVDKPSLLLKAAVQSDKQRLAQAPTLPFEGDTTWGQVDKFGALALAAAIGPQFAESALKFAPGGRGEAILDSLGELSRRRIDDRYARSFLDLKALSEVGYSVQPVNSWASVRAYFEPDGSCLLHIALTPDHVSLEGFSDLYTAGLRATLQLEDGKGRTIFRRRKDIPVSLHRSELATVEGKSFILYDAAPVTPGPTVVRYLLENMVSKEYSTFEQTLAIPSPGAPAMTKPLLGRRGMRIIPEAEAGPRAFHVGNVQIDPAAAGVFGAAEDVDLFIQVTGLSREIKASGAFEAEVRGGREAPRVLRRPLSGYADDNILERLPTKGLAAGSYEVEARLIDGSGKVLFKASCELRIGASTPPADWVAAGTNPPLGDPYYTYAAGTQTAKRGEPAKALKSLSDAWRAREESIEFAVGYADALLAGGNAGPARDVLRRYDGNPDASFDYYEMLGRAAVAAGQVREALDAYSKALLLKRNDPAVLNAVGDCRLALGDTAAAAEVWKRSLEVKPDQPEILKKREAIKLGSGLAF
jgi:GWxTD domain-containing protein